MLKKTAHFQYSEFGSKGGIVRTDNITFPRFSKTKTRIFYNPISRSEELGVIVNRFGIVKAFLYKRAAGRKDG